MPEYGLSGISALTAPMRRNIMHFRRREAPFAAPASFYCLSSNLHAPTVVAWLLPSISCRGILLLLSLRFQSGRQFVSSVNVCLSVKLLSLLVSVCLQLPLLAHLHLAWSGCVQQKGTGWQTNVGAPLPPSPIKQSSLLSADRTDF